jgi:eukaryotic-like serine/threonine-protein kinase
VLITQAHLPDWVKVVDFGLVKEVAARHGISGHSATQQGSITGTPTYMSPEAITRPDQIDARSDVYSLGCLAYFLLTRDVPRPLEALILRCLAKRPEERPAAEELVAALAEHRSRTAESIDETVVARAAPSSAVSGVDETTDGKHGTLGRTEAA